MGSLTEADAKTVQSWLDSDEAVIVDVREAEEWAQARVAGSHHLPLSVFNPNQLPKTDKKMVFLCAHGIRSLQAAQYLLNQDLLDEAVNLRGGISAWAEAGLPLEK